MFSFVGKIPTNLFLISGSWNAEAANVEVCVIPATGICDLKIHSLNVPLLRWVCVQQGGECFLVRLECSEGAVASEWLGEPPASLLEAFRALPSYLFTLCWWDKTTNHQGHFVAGEVEQSISLACVGPHLTLVTVHTGCQKSMTCLMMFVCRDFK